MQSVYVKFWVTIHTAMLALKVIVQPNDQIASSWSTKCVCKSQV